MVKGDVETWCKCGACSNMEMNCERNCCHDLEKWSDRKNDACVHYSSTEPFKCVTEHPSFQLNCLHWEVLEVTYNMFKRKYGTEHYDDDKEKSLIRRDMAYRNLACFLDGTVGKEAFAFSLPSCAVIKIREKFPDDK